MIAVPPPRPPRDPTEDVREAAVRWAVMAVRDWTRDVREVWKLVVYIGRYGKQPIDHVERWPMSKVLRVAKGVSDLLNEEARQAKGKPKSSW